MLGSRIDRLTVFKEIGGSGPNISLVTIISNNYASPTSQIIVFKKLDEAARDKSNEGDNSVVSGRSSLYN